MPEIARDRVNQLYLEFLETAETKRHWSVLNDVPWDKLDCSRAEEADAARIEIFCAEELYIPDYTSNALALLRSLFGMSSFQIRWAFEESKHGLAFKEYLTRSGLRSESEVSALHQTTLSREWELPFDTARRMTCYGALQEGATYAAYKVQKDRASAAGDRVLESIFFYVGRDEAAHGGWYRAMIGLELAEDRIGTIADLAFVLANFKMPGDGLIPDYRERLRSSGAGISPRAFLERVVQPLLAGLGIERDEMRVALRRASDEPATDLAVRKMEPRPSESVG